MTRRIAGLPVWGPGEIIDGMRAVLGWTDDAVAVVGALPERITALLDDVEELVARISTLVGRVEGVAGRAEGLIGSIDATVARVDPLMARVAAVADGAQAVVLRAGAVADGADGVIGRATAVADRANEVVAQASDTSGAARQLLRTYLPIAEQAAPLARRFVSEFSEEELHAAIRMVDQLPALTEHLETDIMPILATLDRVGPDVNELLDVLKDVRQAINGIPGFSYFRRRGGRDDVENGD
jgi:ABC-type transporter Mla subunit MlaD